MCTLQGSIVSFFIWAQGSARLGHPMVLRGWQVAGSTSRSGRIDVAMCSKLTLTKNRSKTWSNSLRNKAPARLTELKRRASECFDFAGIEPNYGHEVIALLLREGLVEVITTNWDTAIEVCPWALDWHGHRERRYSTGSTYHFYIECTRL